MWIICGKAVTGGNLSTRRKPPSSATLSTTNSKWTGLGQNRGFCGVKLETSRLKRSKTKTIKMLMMMTTITVYFMSHL